MNRVTEMELMRLLHGELPSDRASALRARLEREPELAAALARLRATWDGLELPPAAPVPLGFAVRVAARAREEKGRAISWATAPAWVRGAAAAALALGILLGAGAGRWTTGEPVPAEPPVAAQAQEEPASVATADDFASSLLDDSLAGSYWAALDETAESGLTEDTPASTGGGGDAL